MSIIHKQMLFVALLVLTVGALQPHRATEAADRPPMLITEVQYNPFGDDSRFEWIELKVNQSQPLDVSGFKIGDEETIGGQEGMLRFPPDTVIDGNRVVIIAQTAAGFQERYGIKPDYEMQESQPDVPNLPPSRLIALGDIGLANGGDEVILLDANNKQIDSLSYGESSWGFQPTIQPVPEGYSLTRVPANCDTDTAADWQPLSVPNPFIVETDPQCDLLEDDSLAEEGADDTLIGSIQGESAVAQAINEQVEFQGTVIGKHADTNASGITFHTVFVQGTPDNNPETSDGIPAFAALDPIPAGVGDVINISGQVTEFYGLSEIADNEIEITVISRNQPLPDPISLSGSNLPNESMESMLVEIEEAVVAGPTFETAAGCGFAVIPSDVNKERIIRHAVETDISKIIPVLFHNERRCWEMPQLKTGDIVRNVRGPLTWHFDQWKIILQPDFELKVIESELPALPEVDDLDENQISIVSYNLENLFDGIDDTASDAEPKLSAEEIAARIEKYGYVLGSVLKCPTIVAVQEVEKRSLLEQIAEETAIYCGFRYEVSHLESFDERGIDNGLLSDPNQVEIRRVRLRPTCTERTTGIKNEINCPTGKDPLFSRPPLQIDLETNGEQVAVFVNHFKSKRGGEAETEPRRIEQAEHIRSLVKALQAEPDAPHVIVIGDFNDYADSPMFQTMVGDGQLENVLRRLPAEESYTFNFGGAAQMIDGILLPPESAALISEVEILH
ncbi:MAG: lamin tail domain-containing protein, partial [Chloroflexota bacterium]